jgi:hypothetical protein
MAVPSEIIETKHSTISLHELAMAGTRAYAVFILLSSMIGAVQTMAFYLSGEWKNYQGSNPFLYSLSFFVWTAMAIFLLVKSDAIVRFILAGRVSTENEMKIDTSALVSAALMVMGIFFLVSGLQGLLGEGARWLFAAKDELTGQRPHIEWNATLLAGSTVQFIAGFILVIGYRRLFAAFNRMRKLFSLKDDPEVENSEPAQSKEDEMADQDTKQE